ncbi:MAG: HAD family hydrolase [Bacteriovoracia bacterium]
MKLVLFDIDGTLLLIPGAGRKAFSRAFQTVYGVDDDLAQIQFAGATDFDVLDRLIVSHGLTDTAVQRKKFMELLPTELTAAAQTVIPQVYPGVREILSELHAQPETFALGLVTGNIESCARIKLLHAGLSEFFVQNDFAGGFGCDHAHRSEIAATALRRLCVRYPHGFSQVYLVGDTPSDIEAAHAIGARSVAVATGGKYSFADLQMREPHCCVSTLEDTRQVLNFLEATP